MAWVYEFTLNYPTVVYTALLGVVSLYWLLVLSGAFKLSTDKKLLSNDGLLGFLALFGLSELPVDVVVSALILCSWLLTAIITHVLLASLPVLGTILDWLIGLMIILATFFVSLGLTRLWLKPKAKPIAAEFKPAKKPIVVGKICCVTSGAVDERFGEAEYDNDEGEACSLHVRCQAPTRIKRGESALVIEYDSEKDVYWVEPYRDPLV